MQDERLYDEKELEKSWLISYSDLFTLLFVIILIIAAAHSAHLEARLDEVKKAETKQQAELKEAIASKDILSLQKLELQRDIAALEAKRDELRQQTQQVQSETDDAEQDRQTVNNELAAALQEVNVQFVETAEGLRIRLPETILFASGSADLQEDGKKLVGTIAEVLKRFPQRVRIEGYTDNVPIRKGIYRSNWELSSARAISVMREMVDQHGLAPSRFVVAGWGEANPVVDNSNEENRARNRRVEIVILAEKEKN
ncbi:OmpA family protein [Brevibacillus sp. SYP-B805]|uniref:OmpA family protein n=1 Tax=Brevibacillus sp. SYP-B805 TaxID=1578199 RepID=UPI0013ED7544|nr:OmpA family protein [Brevibacillus sp. SYP-B805]NGQ95659.1 OmpA family protein [Brevibacillus sp. SYP-B805]